MGYQRKKSLFLRKNGFLAIFGHFFEFGKITKMAKNPFFLEKSDFFLWHTLIIWENACLMFYKFFGRIEKKSKKSLFFIFFWAKFCTIFNFGGLKMLEIGPIYL